MKPKAGFISFADKRTHALRSESTFFRASYCEERVLKSNSIPMKVFISHADAPICRECVTNIEKEIQ